MREFLFETLQSLKTLTGLKQYDSLLESENAEEQICKLLDELETACRKFGYLSDEKKKMIISRGIMNDDNLTGLTPKKVYKWLSAYWTSLTPADVIELTSPKSNENHEPLDPEAAQKYIDTWKKVHSQIAEPMTRKSKVSVSLSEGRRQHELKQTVVDCPKCENEPETRPLCGYCMGYGKVKRTLL